MTYLNCRRCGLAVRIRATFLTVENCPRCLARRRMISPLFAAPLPWWELAVPERARAAGLGSASEP